MLNSSRLFGHFPKIWKFFAFWERACGCSAGSTSRRRPWGISGSFDTRFGLTISRPHMCRSGKHLRIVFERASVLIARNFYIRTRACYFILCPSRKICLLLSFPWGTYGSICMRALCAPCIVLSSMVLKMFSSLKFVEGFIIDSLTWKIIDSYNFKNKMLWCNTLVSVALYYKIRKLNIICHIRWSYKNL